MGKVDGRLMEGEKAMDRGPMDGWGTMDGDNGWGIDG